MVNVSPFVSFTFSISSPSGALPVNVLFLLLIYHAQDLYQAPSTTTKQLYITTGSAKNAVPIAIGIITPGFTRLGRLNNLPVHA